MRFRWRGRRARRRVRQESDEYRKWMADYDDVRAGRRLPIVQVGCRCTACHRVGCSLCARAGCTMHLATRTA